MLGQLERLQKARTIHTCGLAKDCVIMPGDTYHVGVTLPGTVRYRVSEDEWDEESIEFSWTKACSKHYNEWMEGIY
jgi:hypothetical protein